MTSEEPLRNEESDQDGTNNRRLLSRRHGDRVLITALLGACAFLLLINIVFGTYILVTTSRVDHQAHSLTTFACVQDAAFQNAEQRETKLAKIGPANQRAQHAKSAASLRAYLRQILPLVDCSDIKKPG